MFKREFQAQITVQIYELSFSLTLNEDDYSGLKMDGADVCNAPSIDHLRDGMFCAIYSFPTHVLENNLFSPRLV